MIGLESRLKPGDFQNLGFQNGFNLSDMKSDTGLVDSKNYESFFQIQGLHYIR